MNENDIFDLVNDGEALLFLMEIHKAYCWSVDEMNQKVFRKRYYLKQSCVIGQRRSIDEDFIFY